MFKRLIFVIFANFTKFATLNPCEKPTGSQFAKLNPREKKNFPPFLRISKTYIFTLGSLSINDGHVKNNLQDIKQTRINSLISK